MEIYRLQDSIVNFVVRALGCLVSDNVCRDRVRIYVYISKVATSQYSINNTIIEAK